jgi:MerR family transcriptional regulator, mercuric resistance operon regulatory protein
MRLTRGTDAGETRICSYYRFNHQFMRDAPITSVLSIGDLSRCTGVGIETIRYYERVGLVHAPARTRGGHRAFDESALKQLGFVKRCRELGFGLGDIRALLALVVENDFTCDEVRDLTEKHLAVIRRKRADLQRLERVLAGMIAECRGGPAPECAIVDALFTRQ